MMLMRYWMPVVLLLIGFAITFFIANYSYQRELVRVKQSVSADVDLYNDYLVAETERSLTLLSSMRSFFDVSVVSHSTFNHVASDALTNYRQLQSVYWVPRVEREQRLDYEYVAEQVYPGYEFKMYSHSGALITAKEQDYYYPIYYQRSRGSELLFGLNLADGLLGKELDLIREKGSGSYSIDMKPNLDQIDFDNTTESFLMVMMPVYGRETTSTEAAKQFFKGFLIGVIRIDSLMNYFLAKERYRYLEIVVSDVTSKNRTVFVAMHDPVSSKEVLNQFVYQKHVDITGGRHWLVEGAPTAEYVSSVVTDEWKIISLFGVIITLALTIYVYSLRFRAEHVEDEVKVRTRELSFANKKLEQLARTDSLTQVANRRSFDEQFEREWFRARRENRVLTLVLCDVDYFKKYNDFYGHIDGDRCLQRVAIALNQSFSRSGDFVARYGGEEFAIIVPGVEVTFEGLLEKCVTTIADLHIEHETSPISDYVTMSYGACVVYPSETIDVIDVIKAADKALYRAKLEGRNRGVIVRF